MEVGGSAVVRSLDQQLIVPEADGYAGELLGDRGDRRVQSQVPEDVVLLPHAEQLGEGRRAVIVRDP